MRVARKHQLKHQIAIGDGTERSGGDGTGVFGEDAAGVAGLWRFPGFAALFQFGGREIEIELTFFCVDGDGVAVFDEREWAANVGFGSDVTDDEAVATAGESTVGDEGDVFPEAFAHDGGSG